MSEPVAVESGVEENGAAKPLVASGETAVAGEAAVASEAAGAATAGEGVKMSGESEAPPPTATEPALNGIADAAPAAEEPAAVATKATEAAAAEVDAGAAEGSAE